ncbi:response regulator [Dyadobacter subterraneus]|uniref:Response regulator n=1 Tax=Dyadobacter subterraneus TaxID=2773304 RepID=A0ABR9WET7_9BACT|nr:response regulator [Dyadobacter subterraneus]MBE9464009.1 response regulator [Dyadobacter subterraneus]
MQPIYIADDSADQRYLFGYFLKRVNPEYPVVFFDRAQKLLDSLQSSIQTGGVLPMVVFLDLQMPEVNGFKALEIIMSLNERGGNWPEIPVVTYSGDSDPDMIRKCLDAGALAFLQKPVDLEKLKNLLLLVQP